MELEEILEDIENGGREESGYVVIDVRGTDEIAYTGKLDENVETLPLPAIAQMGVFSMEEDDFDDSFGFQKPSPDETLVFTCKSGIRSMQAAQLAGMAGYSKIINYRGGADEWFSAGPQF
jgi:rhodanese-related sulfurtransferase